MDYNYYFFENYVRPVTKCAAGVAIFVNTIKYYLLPAEKKNTTYITHSLL